MHIAYTITRPGDGIDAALAALARNLAAEGVRVTGAVQHTERDEEGRLTKMELHLLPEMTPVNLAQNLGAAAAGCRLDPGQLEQATQTLSDRLAQGADLLIVPRFGEREQQGKGFRDLIADALGAEIPVLVGVGEGTAPAFEDFASGAATRLDLSPEALRAWAEGALAPA
jgi:hypothetical protein